MENLKEIKEFKGEYFFLSNFFEAPVTYDNLPFQSNESAFQSKKCCSREGQMKFVGLNPSEAKRLGRRVLLREDWENIKDKVMYDIVYAKFSQNPELKEMLLATGDAYLEEGNTWGDKYWGTVDGVGRNQLGKTLMSVREKIRKETEAGTATKRYIEISYIDKKQKEKAVAIIMVSDGKEMPDDAFAKAKKILLEKLGVGKNDIVILDYRDLGRKLHIMW